MPSCTSTISVHSMECACILQRTVWRGSGERVADGSNEQNLCRNQVGEHFVHGAGCNSLGSTKHLRPVHIMRSTPHSLQMAYGVSKLRACGSFPRYRSDLQFAQQVGWCGDDHIARIINIRPRYTYALRVSSLGPPVLLSYEHSIISLASLFATRTRKENTSLRGSYPEPKTQRYRKGTSWPAQKPVTRYSIFMFLYVEVFYMKEADRETMTTPLRPPD